MGCGASASPPVLGPRGGRSDAWMILKDKEDHCAMLAASVPEGLPILIGRTSPRTFSQEAVQGSPMKGRHVSFGMIATFGKVESIQSVESIDTEGRTLARKKTPFCTNDHVASEEEARIVVSFDSTASDHAECRTMDRKKTPFLKKEHVPSDEEALIAVNFDTAISENTEGRTLDRKKTPFIRGEDVPSEEVLPHESDSEREV